MICFSHFYDLVCSLVKEEAPTLKNRGIVNSFPDYHGVSLLSPENKKKKGTLPFHFITSK